MFYPKNDHFYQIFKKSCLYTYLKIVTDYMINHMISYLSNHAEHPFLSYQRIVNYLTYFYTLLL